MRESGILMPVFSLPGPWGIGTLGQPAYTFVDFLHSARQSVWQILPLSPTGFGNSPYQSCSAFAGNPYLIDFDLLCADGLLEPEDCAPARCAKPGAVDYSLVEKTHLAVLRKAFARFSQWYPDEYYRFCYEQGWWLEDYALFMTARGLCGGAHYLEWPDALRRHEKSARDALYAQHEPEVHFWKFCQYIFAKQWALVRRYANERGVRLLGDIPIYVSGDSADVWAAPQLFQLNADGRPASVAGCPPDYFSASGQLWGNPLYDWEKHKSTDYEWWARRVGYAMAQYDTVRIDHFRAFDTYYAIPGDAQDARGGEWRTGPGLALFRALERRLGGALPIVAEDLGELFPSVRELLRASGYPGMKVLQFAFDPDSDSEYLPHNYPVNSVAYPGTHDNTTLADWLRCARAGERRKAAAYFGLNQQEGYVEGMLRGILASPSALCVIPMADWLGLGASGRINTPSTVGGKNWTWRARAARLTPALAQHIAQKCALYGRCGAAASR